VQLHSGYKCEAYTRQLSAASSFRMVAAGSDDFFDRQLQISDRENTSFIVDLKFQQNGDFHPAHCFWKKIFRQAKI